LVTIWYALNNEHVDTCAFIFYYLVENSKISPNNVIVVGGIITAIGIGLEKKFGTLETVYGR